MDREEFRRAVEADESPEVKSYEVIQLLDEIDAYRDAAQSALSLLENIGTGKWAKTPAGDKLRTVLSPSGASAKTPKGAGRGKV